MFVFYGGVVSNREETWVDNGCGSGPNLRPKFQFIKFQENVKLSLYYHDLNGDDFSDLNKINLEKSFLYLSSDLILSLFLSTDINYYTTHERLLI